MVTVITKRKSTHRSSSKDEPWLVIAADDGSAVANEQQTSVHADQTSRKIVRKCEITKGSEPSCC